MSEGLDVSTRPVGRVGRVLFRLSEGLAIVGGVVVGAMAIVITVNIIGRAAFSASIAGIVDLIEIATCTAVFAFLPYCQMTRSNVIVDFIMSAAPTRAKTACDAAGAFLYLLVGALLTWRLVLGGVDMHRYNEVTSTLGFPRWMSFPYAALCMLLLLAVIAYTIARSIAETRAGRYFDPSSEAAAAGARRIRER